MDATDLFWTGAIVFSVLLALYWLSLMLRSDWFWNWIIGVDDQTYSSTFSTPSEPYREPYKWPSAQESYVLKPLPPWPAPVVVVRARKSLGPHKDILNLEDLTCEGEFEQMDPRTWQCLKCHMLHFAEVEKQAQGEPKA